MRRYNPNNTTISEIMFYINKKGIVIEALQATGDKGNQEKIENFFKVIIDYQAFFDGKWEVLRQPDRIFLGYIKRDDYVFQGILNVKTLPQDEFEKHFKPITSARVALVENFKKEMLLKLEQRQQKDDWREQSFEALNLALLVEYQELREELDKILNKGNILGNILGNDTASFDSARKKCADVADYAAMIHDKLNSLELDAMWNDTEKISEGLQRNIYA